MQTRRPPPPPARLCRAGSLLTFLHGARQQLLRVGALLNDPNKFAPVALLCPPNGPLDTLAKHAQALVETADSLAAFNVDLMFARVPIFDVHAAADVLGKGGQAGVHAASAPARGRPARPHRAGIAGRPVAALHASHVGAVGVELPLMP
jgi:hypothetical protein